MIDSHWERANERHLVFDYFDLEENKRELHIVVR